MLELVINRGVPGSGKSTYANVWITSGPNRVRVNRDDIRFQCYGTYFGPPIDENVVTSIEDAMILSSLRSGSSVIVDDCNIEPKYIKRLAHMGWSNGAEVRVNTVNVPLSVALDRNSKRGRIVPDNVIIKMHQRLSEIGEVALQKPLAPEPYVMPDDGPEAILLDLDGTACIMGDRGPYDWSRVGEDSPNWPVINLANLEAMNGTLIIPFSGRDGICRDETIKWLNRYVLWEDLHMRPIGDKRKDSVVKLELFNEHIRHNYRIKYVLDDRQQVVDMWRDLGLTCLQVAKGDF